MHARGGGGLPARDPLRGLSPGVEGTLLRRLERERAIRLEAERIAERATRELYDRQEALTTATAQARGLLADALNAEDRERRRLARLLHDTTLQTLLAAAQDLEEAAEDPRRDGPLSRGAAGLTVAIGEMREILRGIHPPALDHGGLAVALSELAADARTRGGIVDVSSLVEVTATPSAHDELVMVLAREFVRNTVEHAGAGRLRIELRRREPGLRLVVADDGRGIAPGRREEAVAGGHLGLVSCAERVTSIGGWLTVGPDGPGAGPGTRVEVVLPL